MKCILCVIQMLMWKRGCCVVKNGVLMSIGVFKTPTVRTVLQKNSRDCRNRGKKVGKADGTISASRIHPNSQVDQ